jgi:MerR family transcriptional regulator, light-induced transcriptional regulator
LSKTNEKAGFSIAAVERDVGLSKDVLRAWERRCGFPAPERDTNGERV